MKRLVAKVGEYTKDGQQKGEYVRIGVIMSNDNGEYALIDPCVNLAGVLQKQNRFNHSNGKKTGDSVMCSIFDDTRLHRQDTQQQADRQQAQQSAPNMGDFDDDIPF